MSSEAVKVCVRCRPANQKEKDLGCNKIVGIHKDIFQVTLKNPEKLDEEPKAFTFDAVFDDDSTQQGVYEETAYSLVLSVMDGYNGTIFAYGQTGCGKTFTMEGVRGGPPHLRGIIPGTFEQIFEQIGLNKVPNKQFLVQAAYLEIYNEEVRDLVSNTPKTPLDLKEDPDKGVYVKGLSQNIMRNSEQVMDLMAKGNEQRSVGFTLMNAGSSRSHSIFILVIETSIPDEAKPGELKIKAGKLNLVDLAGSERQGKTGAEGVRLKEATKINLSLSALGNVISALVTGAHIPYRDSKLTRMLQDSLGGNTKTIMIAAVSPADYNFEETLSTLRYANRAKNIKNKPKINEDPKDALLSEYANEIARLKAILESEGLALGDMKGGVPADADNEEEEEDSSSTDKKKRRQKKKRERRARALDTLEVEDLDGEDAERREKDLERKEKQKKLDDDFQLAKQQMLANQLSLEKERAEHERMAQELADRVEKEALERARLEQEHAQLRGGKRDKELEKLNDRQKQLQEEMEQHMLIAAELQEKMYDEAQRHDELHEFVTDAKKKLGAEQQSLQEKLAELQKQLLQGGQIKEELQSKQSEMRKKHRAALEEQAKALRLKQEESEALQEKNLMVEEKYSSLKAEIEGKTKKLQLLRQRLHKTQSDLEELIEEMGSERQLYLDNIRNAMKELALHKKLVCRLLDKGEIKRIAEMSIWVEDTLKHILPKIELPLKLPAVPISGASAPVDKKKPGSSSWAKSVVATQAEFEEKALLQERDSLKQKSTAPTRLQGMKNQETSPALRGDSLGGPLLGPSRIASSTNMEPDLLATTLDNVRRRANFDVKIEKPASKIFSLDSVELPARPNFCVPKPDVSEPTLNINLPVPRRANFDVSGGLGKLGDTIKAPVGEDTIAALDKVPQRKNFENKKVLSKGMDPQLGKPFLSLEASSSEFEVPLIRRANFQPGAKGALASNPLSAISDNPLFKDVPMKPAFQKNQLV